MKSCALLSLVQGILSVEMLKHNETYTWTNVNCVVHNIIVGSLWMEHVGVMEIRNHTNDLKAVISFRQALYFMHRILYSTLTN